MSNSTLIALTVFTALIIVLILTRKTGFSLHKDSDLIEVGRLLFPDHKAEFEKFFNSFLTDKKKFLSEYENLLEFPYDDIELTELSALSVIDVFGSHKNILFITDWRGEENEKEIEEFFETQLNIKNEWNNVNKLRKEVDIEEQRDGKFIVQLLKTFDKDLNVLNKKLIFLDLGSDSYVYTVVDKTIFKTITNKFGTLFHGTEKLRI